MPDFLHDLRARLPGLMPADRYHLKRRLDGAARIDSPDRRRAVLDDLAAEVGTAEARYARRKAASPTRLAYPAELPITDKRQELLETFRDHQVVIVAGESGSGKSTQIPKL